MDDLISRQAAIDALHMHLMYRMGTDSNKKRLDDWINGVPSAQPERLKGRWIESHEHAYIDNGVKEWINWYCSECDAPNSDPTDFCPNCGADMRGDKA